MDIKSMLSGGGAAAERRQEQQQQSSLDGQRDEAPNATPPLATSAAQGPPPPQQYPHNSSQHHASPYAPPPHLGSGVRSIPAQSMGMTPLSTSPPLSGPGQHHFQSHSSQSPAARTPQGPYHRPGDVTTPGGRPPSHGQQFAPPPLPQQVSSGIGGPQGYGKLSHSPTPPSHLGHTPVSNRQSPLSVMNQQPGAQAQYHRSQPNTPMVAPPLQSQRSATFTDMHSPSHHHRTASTASSGILPNSPAHHHMHLTHQMGSPRTYASGSPHLRRSSSDFAGGQSERERSVSVSPKTMIPPRPPSLGSRHSSYNDAHSARSSVHMNGPPSGSPGHFMHPQRTTPSLQQSTSQPPLSSIHEISHSQTSPPPPPSLSNAPSGSAAPDGVSPLPQARMSQQPVLHHAQKMTFNHLLTPTTELPPTTANGSGPLSQQRADRTPIENHQQGIPGPSPQLPHSAASNASSADYFHGASTNHRQSLTSSSPSRSHSMKDRHSPASSHAAASAQHVPASDRRPLLKRQADSELQGPPSKQIRMQNRQRPPWAQYCRDNPRSDGRQPQNGAAGRSASSRPPLNASSSSTNGGPVRMPHASQPAASGTTLDGRPPWLHNPPLDMDLINARNVMGPWEKTFKWNTPLPSLLEGVQDWMFLTLDSMQDVGWDPSEGAIEIEAKIGKLIHQDGEHRDRRCALPVATATVIHPGANKNYRFESRMDEKEHEAMNRFLNETIRETMQKGRVPMTYKHLYELDSFRDLSPAGLRAIPASLQRRSHMHRDPKLRTTTELDKTGNPQGIKARIVKLNIDNLHIFNPRTDYDCRISVNLEVNLNQPHLHPLDPTAEPLTLEPTEAKPTELSRHKDRMSYKHLAYSVDLTKVERDGLSPTHELELEVDGNLLRQHHALLKRGEPNAFADLLSGFLDNAAFLMRQRGGG